MQQLCANCGHAVDNKYCPNCGQKNGEARLTIHSLLHDAWHGITHTDKGILRLWIDLLVKPKQTYQGYFAGHRKSYFSPVMFFLLSFGLYIFLDHKVFDYQDHINLLETGRPLNNEYGRYVQEHSKYIALIALPFQSLLTWLLFNKRYNLAECVVFWLFCVGFINTIVSIATPLRLVFIHEKDQMDYLLNLMSAAISLLHVCRVFATNFLQVVLATVMVFLLTILNAYIALYFFVSVADINFPTFGQVIETTFGNKVLTAVGKVVRVIDRQ
jgi:hypothetical protein